MMQKFEFTGEKQGKGPGRCKRIRALIDIPGVVKAGELGGWLMSENNLSHEGRCWVADEAMILGEAEVLDDALVSGQAIVTRKVKVLGSSTVSGNVFLSGVLRLINSHVTGSGLLQDGLDYFNATVFLADEDLA